MKDMTFKDCSFSNSSKINEFDYIDFYVLASTSNKDYLNKAKAKEDFEDGFENQFCLLIPYNTKTKRFHPKHSSITYITYHSNAVEIDKICNKEDIKEIVDYIKSSDSFVGY